MFSQILKFYDQHKRSFPWRHTYGIPNPYYVYVSEIMLQQTTTGTVIDYFNRFIQRFPTLEHLAKADVNEVLLLWQGLGYYSRGRNLHKAAQIIMADNGKIPDTYKDLTALPGIGDYTAKAILAIAYQKNVLPIDGNIKRVLSRYFGLDTPYEKLEKAIQTMDFDFHKRPGDVCQGLMDFANTICLPRNPKCDLCPLNTSCFAYQHKKVSELPRPKNKIAKKIIKKDGWVCIQDGAIGLNYHAPGTLLGGLWNIPMTDKHEHIKLKGNSLFSIRHIFTHIDLHLDIYMTDHMDCDAFVRFDEISQYPLSRLTQKILEQLNRFDLKTLARPEGFEPPT